MSITSSILDKIKLAIERFAKENNVTKERIQIGIFSDKEYNPGYLLFLDSKFNKQLSFNNILGVKIDFMMREMVATPYIQGFFKKASIDFKINPENLLFKLAYYQYTDEQRERVKLQILQLRTGIEVKKYSASDIEKAKQALKQQINLEVGMGFNLRAFLYSSESITENKNTFIKEIDLSYITSN